MIQLLALVLFDSIAFVVTLVALIRVITSDPGLWPHGRLSKTAWVVAVLWLNLGAHGIALPIGAVVAIWHTHRLIHSKQTESLDVPFAEGAPLAEEDQA